MEILWLINVPLPEASILLNEEPTPFGGWLVNASKALSERKDIKLSIAFPKVGISNVKPMQGEKIYYYAFPIVGQDLRSIEENEGLINIINFSKPDIVHIFGTEYAHTLAMVNICKREKIKVVISIQGLVSIYAKHYMAYLPKETQSRYTIRDFLKKDNLEKQQQRFIERGKLEINALEQVSHVIGRTTWDKACTTQINSNVQYHFCNETLREEFYKHKWDIQRCEKYSIFISQGGYPIKGLHFVLEAMPLILKRYPEAKLYIGGHDITKSDTFKEKLRLSSYGKYIKDLIKNNDLNGKVIFTGVLNEKDMCLRYLNSNVFVCPSSIENSPNSLGEAMILGVPSVASDVGGVADMLQHREEGYVYQTDAPYMMAHYICEIFANKNLALEFSEKARSHALSTHDRERNTERLIEIYKKINKL